MEQAADGWEGDAAILRMEEFSELPNSYFFQLRQVDDERGGDERVEASLNAIG